MNDKAEKVLKILDENGFDWFGRIDDRRFTLRKFSAKNSGIILYADGYNSCGYINCKNDKKDKILIIRSLADLATNKSALEAAFKKFLKHWESKGLMPPAISIDDLQKTLIKDITYKKCENFWQIWLDFLGAESEGN